MTVSASCSVCRDIGGCPSDHGAGLLNGKRCLICRGSGTCPVCGRVFTNPVAGWEEDSHSTHPPLRDRVALARALDLAAPATSSDERPAVELLAGLMQPAASS